MSLIPLYISLGAVLGALSRYYLTLFWLKKRESFPYGTLFANLTGAFLIGFVSKIFASEHTISIGIQKLILVGFLGSYTTFSSYILDSANLLRNNRTVIGFFYWLGSPILGFIFVELGIWSAQRIVSIN